MDDEIERRKAGCRRAQDNEVIERILATLRANDERMDEFDTAMKNNAKSIYEIRESIAEPLEIILAFRGMANVLTWFGRGLKWTLGIATAILLFWIASKDAFKDLFK